MPLQSRSRTAGYTEFASAVEATRAALPFALGAECEAELAFDPRLSWAASLYGVGPVRATVRVRRLEATLSAEGTPLPRLLKLDVEGHECEALRGARATIKQAAVSDYEFFRIGKHLEPIDPRADFSDQMDVLARPASR